MAENVETRTGKTSDIEGILHLQSRNLYANLSPEERENGFVTTPFSPSQFAVLLSEEGIFVAAAGEKIVGYALAGTWEYFSQWPIFPYMVSRFPDLRFAGRVITDANSFQYGPVCIDINFRGSGLFPNLFEEMRLSFANRFPIGVTFINRLNQRSHAAHTRKLGMEVIDNFDFGDRPYYGLGFDTSVSVLNRTASPR